MIRALVKQLVLSRPGWQAVAHRDRLLQARRQGAELGSEMRLEGRDRVEADESLIRVVQQFPQRFSGRQRLVWLYLLTQHQHEQAMLRHG